MAAADRGSNLTQSLLTFSRKQSITLKIIQINYIIQNVEKFLGRIIGEDIKLVKELTNEDTTVRVDQGQVEQVIVNLATNARDAMPKGGFLTIRTEIETIDDSFIEMYHYGSVGQYVVMHIKDTGIGMDEQTKSRIFEPFFTTKEVGKGTGLGLAIVYGIIKQHNGYINVYSEVGVGTEFKIYFPFITSTFEVAKPVEVPMPQGGNETILFAEDNAELRKITKEILAKFGYNVIEAVDGEDAINIYKANKDKIKLLLFDIIMPKINGIDTYNEIRKMSPDIKVLFTSGYTTDIIQQKGIKEQDLDIISKPLSPLQLLRKIREVLDK
jgi:CheY-like chemotaxis protein